MKTGILIFLLLILIPFLDITAQREIDTLEIAFWNLQNLFDTKDDIEKDDEEFLPSSDRNWNDERLDKKLYNLARIIRTMNNQNGPDILGVCEVEHQHLLDTLSARFFDNEYKTAYSESPDRRGIDNGLLYKTRKFSLISVIADTIKLPDNNPTRSILNVKLLSATKDTFYIFINHWPSRRGGEATVENRIIAAKTLRNSIEKLPGKKIIIIGDFNDEPVDHSLLSVLKANPVVCDSLLETDILISDELILLNLAYEAYSKGEGTFRYGEKWNMLDQIIISKEVFEDDYFSFICNSFKVFKPEILVTKSGFYKGAPFPTYGGRRYLGGYSDHFPVTTKIILRGK